MWKLKVCSEEKKLEGEGEGVYIVMDADWGFCE